ncbi:hypothetical protein [Rubrivirga sp.]|uniref:hypothetical protein n=1 Tax=Rubrivirga sp. TaxID=1885344 RepID=UPI003C73A9B8
MRRRTALFCWLCRPLDVRGRLAALCCAAVALAGCSDAFDPRAETDLAFAVFGALDGRESRQVLRVKDLRAPLNDIASLPPPIVTSTELTSGRETAWRDSLVVLEDGSTDRVAIADLEVAAGDVHRIEVVRDDGARSVSTVTLGDPAVQIDSISAAPTFRVFLSLRDLVGRATEGTVRYSVQRADGSGAFDLVVPTRIPLGDPALSALLGTAREQSTQILYGSAGGDVELLDVRFEAVILSEQPAALEDGVGGIDWAVPVSLPLLVPTDVVMQAGFVDKRLP